MPDEQTIERRYIDQPVAIEERADEQPQIEGYAAVFYNGKPETEFVLWDGAVERVMPGAFDRAIKEDDVRALFNHDPNMILGRTTADTLALQADSRGLKYTIKPPDTATGRDVLTSVRRGDVTGSSFSFVPIDIEWRIEDGVEIREIRSVRVPDLGPVAFPAYGLTTAGVRAVGIVDITHMGSPQRAHALVPGMVDNVRAEREAWRERVALEQEAETECQREKRDRKIRLLLTDAKIRG